MKKRMKMKKYAEGGMSDDESEWGGHTTRVVDEDTDEVIYEKPEPKYTESKKAESKKAESKKAESKKAESKKAEPKKEPEAYRDFSKLGRGAIKRERTPEEKEKNAKNLAKVAGAVGLATGVGGVTRSALGAHQAANYARNTGYKTKEMFGSRKAAEEFAKSGGMKRGGSVKSSASRRADGIASRGKTKGRFV